MNMPDREPRVDHTPSYVTGVRLALVVVALALTLFVTMLDLSIVATAAPRITNEFHSLKDVGWYGAAFQLACAPMQLLSGKMYTYFPNKSTFLVFFAVFELGSLVCALATSSKMLIVGRAVAGLGGAGLQNGSLTIVANLTPLAMRAVLNAIILGVGQLGIVAGPLIGGVFTELVTWRWCFYVNLPIGGVVAALVLLIHIPDRSDKLRLSWPWSSAAVDAAATARTTSPDTAANPHPLRTILFGHVDLVGFALFAGATVQLLLALQWGGSVVPWNNARVIGLFVGAGATGLVWMLWNCRMNQSDSASGDTALVPLAILRHRAVWTGGLTCFLLMGALMLQAYYMAIYFQAARHASPVMSGVDILPNVIAQILSAVLSGVSIGKLGYYLPWAVGGLATSTIGMGLLSTLTPAVSTGRWIGYQALTGIGRGMAFQVPFLAIQHVLAPQHISVAIGLLSFCQNFGGAVLLTVASVIFDNSLLSRLRIYVPNVDAETVIAAGATAFRTVVPPYSVRGVVRAYTDSIDRVFYFGTALALLSTVSACGLGWHDIRAERTVPGAAAPEAPEEDSVHEAKSTDDKV